MITIHQIMFGVNQKTITLAHSPPVSPHASGPRFSTAKYTRGEELDSHKPTEPQRQERVGKRFLTDN